MKQLLQSARTGEMSIQEVPIPAATIGDLLIHTNASLVSAGTERALVHFSQQNLLQKARSRPDMVRQVIEKDQRDGLLTTMDTVRTRLDTPMALGYSSSGVVLDMGKGCGDIQIADRVACAGFGYAVHAEVVSVPRNLVVPVPDGVSDEEAAFTTLGAIALQGVRQVGPQLGDNVAVIGLGLLGQLTLQLLKANGCRVFGVDLDVARVALARELGIDQAALRPDAEEAGMFFTHNRGFDSVLITADTASNDPLILAGELARDKGAVVAIGAVGMEIPRKLYYMKELDFRLSRSYGPGRYDPQYEEHGVDYPYGYVRWTENRNMQAFLNLLATGQVRVAPLITHRYPIEQAETAYQLITGQLNEPFLGVVLTYPEDVDRSTFVQLRTPTPAGIDADSVRVGMVGAGSFANSVLLPAMQKIDGLYLHTLCASTGISSMHGGKRFGFEQVSTDIERLLQDPVIDLIALATPHNLHAEEIIAGLVYGKHIFCEKPLCLNEEELAAIGSAYVDAGDRHLMVGFNRRFAPLAQKLHGFAVQIQEPLLVHYRVNGGHIPLDHWTQDPKVGGGRVIGEVCHFIDFATFLVGESPTSVFARALPNHGRYADDNVSLILNYPNGSVANITYAANGDKSLGKERVELFGGGRSAVLEDFRHLTLLHNSKRQTHQLRFRQDKGHVGEWKALVHALRSGGATPIPFKEIISTTVATFRAIESMRSGQLLPIQNPWL